VVTPRSTQADAIAGLFVTGGVAATSATALRSTQADAIAQARWSMGLSRRRCGTPRSTQADAIAGLFVTGGVAATSATARFPW
jgi:hypothetical protein